MVALKVELRCGGTSLSRYGRLYSRDRLPSRLSMRLRLLPTFFTAFFTAALDRPVFFASYLTS
jgi:hypothetical protein